MPKIQFVLGNTLKTFKFKGLYRHKADFFDLISPPLVKEMYR